MIPTHRRAGNAVVKQGGHVCLSCRLKTHPQQRRHLTSQDPRPHLPDSTAWDDSNPSADRNFSYTADVTKLQQERSQAVEKFSNHKRASRVRARTKKNKSSGLAFRPLLSKDPSPPMQRLTLDAGQLFKKAPSLKGSPLVKVYSSDDRSVPREMDSLGAAEIRREKRQEAEETVVRGIARKPHAEKTFNLVREREMETREFDTAMEGHLDGVGVLEKTLNLKTRADLERSIGDLEGTLERELEKQGSKLSDLADEEAMSRVVDVLRYNESARWCLKSLEELYALRRGKPVESDSFKGALEPVLEGNCSANKAPVAGITPENEPAEAATLVRDDREVALDSRRFRPQSTQAAFRAGRRAHGRGGDSKTPIPSPIRYTNETSPKLQDSKFTDSLDDLPNANAGPLSSTTPKPVEARSQMPLHLFAWQRANSSQSINQQARAFHTTRPHLKASPAPSSEDASYMSPYAQPAPVFDMSSDPNYHAPTKNTENPNGIRAQLRRWQDLHGQFEEPLPFRPHEDEDADGGTANSMSRLSDEKVQRRDPEIDAQDEQEAEMEFAQAQMDEDGSSNLDPRFLRKGDLCEIEFPMSERECILAIFVQRIGDMAQFYTIQGRWMHMAEKKVQYAVPQVVTEDMLKPLLEFLPTAEDMAQGSAFMDLAYVEDLSVPRRVSSPVIDRLVAFQRESDEIYRRHASSLDAAHEVLAHDTDLRYGSLVSAATTLLRIGPGEVTPAALFTVRKALTRAGYAFNVDRRSHRRTGYLQIRSRDQVKMVEYVRNWMRDWQDDLAIYAGKSEKAKLRHKSTGGSQIVQGFIEKTKSIVKKARENRSPTPNGGVGPSKVRLPITKDQGAVRMQVTEMFSREEEEVLRFIEAWCCSNMFAGLPRLESLPPLLLQATGLYDGDEFEFVQSTGFTFLQEIGTILPYENRIRFDQHLLLPSSQHSRPLQKLMTNILGMNSKPGFEDSMADLRHDWGQMPVFCVDGAGAHEIDDGVSLERAGKDPKTKKQTYWVHVHIANPTAFFSRDHPLAKMARHMGESIYMPERAYMMLPTWATRHHFSLAPDRPCITFSTKMDEDGNKLDHAIRPGRIHNVMRLTPSEVNPLISEDMFPKNQKAELVMTVGGDPPPARPHRSNLHMLTADMIKDLNVISRLAYKRSSIRRTAGGVFFDTRPPEVNVWQSHVTTGLAWDHPYRKGSRNVEGDPVIQYRTQPFLNWFSAESGAADNMVREMMLLTCETSAAWCAERQIPVLYRGSMQTPDQMNSERFMKEILLPAAEKNGGEYPLALGKQYTHTLGATAISTTPLKHRTLGLDYYAKATSPLRRYGDMILHWQIEAALREEARTGQSLITHTARNTNALQSFLPFPTQVLQTIITGLQPRESIIVRSKGYSERHWATHLFFRAFYFGEAEFPTKTFTALVYNRVVDASAEYLAVYIEELNYNATLYAPEGLRQKNVSAAQGGLRGWYKAGDVWECKLESVHAYRRQMTFRATRLVSREEWCDLL